MSVSTHSRVDDLKFAIGGTTFVYFFAHLFTFVTVFVAWSLENGFLEGLNNILSSPEILLLFLKPFGVAHIEANFPHMVYSYALGVIVVGIYIWWREW